MTALANLLHRPKSRKAAVAMALLGAVSPLAGIHKFYLGQPVWGVVYLLLASTPMPQTACAIEAVWYLLQDYEEFDRRFNPQQIAGKSAGLATPNLALAGIFTTALVDNSDRQSKSVENVAQDLRQLDQLRSDGLISEYEFEQKRRQLLDGI